VGSTKALSAVVGSVLLIMVLVMFLNKGSLVLSASPTGAKAFGSY